MKDRHMTTTRLRSSDSVRYSGFAIGLLALVSAWGCASSQPPTRHVRESCSALAKSLTAQQNAFTDHLQAVRAEHILMQDYDREMIDLLLPLAPQTRYGDVNYRADDFPTVIECAVPFCSYECGGPVVDLTGRAIGVTIARVAPHGGMVIPGDCVLKLLPDLRAGGLAGNAAPGRSRGK